MRDAINKAAIFIINRCLADRVGNLVIGWNEGQKVGSSMGKVSNQNFVPIPTGRLIERLKNLCPESGIVLTITEESYTSKSSFLDNDLLPKYGEKPERYKFSGTRITRGQYKTQNGTLLNADCHGAANILKKVATHLGLCLEKVSKGNLTVPHRYDLFRDLKKQYRTKLRSVALAHGVTTA
jgi:IS605 OrfB family transposase